MYECALELDRHHSATLCNYAMLQAQRDDGKGHLDHSAMLYDEALASAPKTADAKAKSGRRAEEDVLAFDGLLGQERMDLEALVSARLGQAGTDASRVPEKKNERDKR